MNAHRSFVWRCCGCKEDHDVREGVVIAFVRDDRNGSRSVAKLNHDVEFGAEPSNRSALRYSYIVVGLELIRSRKRHRSKRAFQDEALIDPHYLLCCRSRRAENNHLFPHVGLPVRV